MLLQNPFLGAPLLSQSLPEILPDAFDRIARQRNVEFAVILEIIGLPKFSDLAFDGPHPLLMGPLLGGFGAPGTMPSASVTPEIIRISDFPYRTRPDDPILPNMFTEARMTRRADVEQSAAISQGATRRAQTTVGDIEFADADRWMLEKTDNLSFSGRPAQVHLVPIGEPWSKKVTVAQAVVRSVTRNNNSARVALQDASSILDSPISRRIYNGGGLRDGYEQIRGTAAPVAWGFNRFAKPLLEDPSIYLYRLADGPIQSVSLVEERGLAFSYAGNFASYELLRVAASTIPEGSYATCLADGSIVIKFAGGSPLDPDAIRVSFEGMLYGGSYVSFMGDVMLAMLLEGMGVPTSQVDIPSFLAMPEQKISYFFGGGVASPTGAQVFSELFDGFIGVFGSVNSERVGVKLSFPPTNQPAAFSFVESEIFNVADIEAPQKPIYEQEMGYGKTQNPYTIEQLAPGLTQDQIDVRTRPYLGSYVSRRAPVKASDVTAVAGEIIVSAFDEIIGVTDAVERLLGIWGVSVKAFEVELAFTAANVTRGATVSFTHPDLGAKSGGKFLVYNKRLELGRKRTILTVVG